MIELWDKVECEQCGEEYIFADGPKCLCEGEWESWNEKYKEEFKDALCGGVVNGN